MLTDLIALDASATIKVAQSTYIHLQVGNELFKVQFREKAEVFLKPEKQGILTLHQHHPLLLRYNEPRVSIYVASKTDNPVNVCQDIGRAVSSVLQGWRDWRIDLFGNNKVASEKLLQENLRDGYGLLMDGASAPIAKAILVVCNEHGLRTNVRGDLDAAPVEPPPYHLLLIGRYYAIAKKFEYFPL